MPRDGSIMKNPILIVDDEESIRTVIAQRLIKENYSCVTASNGKEALRHLYGNNFSLIISDVKMPEMDGMELLSNVKALDPNMMMIVMTAYPEIDIAIEAMRLGAYDFIIKPFDLELMVLTVKKALETKKLQEELEDFDNRLRRLVETRTAKLNETLRALKMAHFDSVKVLVGAIDAKDPYTVGHSDRVRKMSLKIGTKLDFREDRLERLEYGALLHDIGMIGIGNEILQKKDPLSPEEYQYIRTHPLIGVKIVEGVEFFKDKIPMIRHHHEHFDGSGYPDGLLGVAIPLEARIILVSDAFDAMTSLRPHHQPIALEDALGELEKGRGKQFDPEMVEIFLNERIYEFGISS
jgi:putative two-component system response regulator